MYQNSQQSPQMPKLSSRDTPVTLVLIMANVLTFLLIHFGQGRWLVPGMALTPESLRHPWTVLTWPLIGLYRPFGLLCLSLWTWTIGGSMERSWGTERLLKFVLATTVLTSVTVLPMLVWGSAGIFGGLGIAIAPLTVAWCWLNRQQTILFSFIFPVPALAIAAITAGMAYFETSQSLRSPWTGLVGLSGCAAAWWWVRGGREWSEARFGKKKKDAPNLRFADLDKDIRGSKQPRSNPLQKARDERKRKERDDKIAEMFRNSGFKDDD
jgi:membrane associated rhomboid family serine protease